jgi:ferrochelatase
LAERRPGLLLVNLGTPKAPTAAEVRPYLREFLTDGRVIDIPTPFRWALVNGVIAPFRAPKSAEAYEAIWSNEGSPLLVISESLAAKVQAQLPGVEVALAMRYGEPSIPAQLERMRAAGVDHLVVFPLYPQYSSAANGSTLERVMEIVAEWWAVPTLSFVPPFYDDPAFLDAAIAAGKPTHDAFAPDHVLFSFHGLPERHVEKCDPTGAYCNKQDGCCDKIVDANRFCYRAQCFATARGLAARLGIAEDGYTIAFQSRLGKDPWVKPYTDEVVPELAKKGVKKLAVYCPAFVADCLETLEEIGIRAKEDFLAAGGEDLALIPCANDHPRWVDGVVSLAQKSCGWLAAGTDPAAA